MKSPYQRIIVYDLETGGLNEANNNITEIAMVAIDLENLEIIDTYTSLIRPEFDLSYMNEDVVKESRTVFKNLAEPDPDTKVKSLTYKGQTITLKSLESLQEDMKLFQGSLPSRYLSLDEMLDLCNPDKNPSYCDIAEIYYKNTYNPQALDVTGIPRSLIEADGRPANIVAEEIVAFVEKHTIGNSKPILAGHNIKKFDNPFFEKYLARFKVDLQKLINQTQMIDTIEWARLRWFELSNYTLGNCANEVGLTLKDAHRALPDTESNAKFLVKMLKSFRGEGAGGTEKYVRRKFNFNF